MIMINDDGDKWWDWFKIKKSNVSSDSISFGSVSIRIMIVVWLFDLLWNVEKSERGVGLEPSYVFHSFRFHVLPFRLDTPFPPSSNPVFTVLIDNPPHSSRLDSMSSILSSTGGNQNYIDWKNERILCAKEFLNRSFSIIFWSSCPLDNRFPLNNEQCREAVGERLV